MTDTTPKPIHAVLIDVMDDIGAVRKGDRNQQQNFNFRGIDAVINAASPAFRKHGVTVRPDVQSVDYATMSTRAGGTLNSCRLIVRYVFTGPAGDSLDATVAAEAFDSGDKATPKAMSVAMRTALLQTLALPTDEVDPDASTYEAAPAPATAAAAPQGPPDANAVIGEILDARDVDTLRRIYAKYQIGNAPIEVRTAFDEAAARFGGGPA